VRNKKLKKISASNTATYSAQQQHQEQYDAKAGTIKERQLL
jgi:hypothetical protein